MNTNYNIGITWASHGGNVVADLNRIQYGLAGVGDRAAGSGRQVGYTTRQLNALGTTLRYTFAGATVYGLINTISLVNQLQEALGGISAIATNPSGSYIVGKQLDLLGRGLLDASTRTVTNVEDLAASTRNIYSTLQNLDPDKAVEFAEMFAKGAKVAETDAYNFGNAVLGMRNAFDKDLSEMGKIADEFFTVINDSAGMTGDEWAKFSGRVVAGAKMAGVSLEEMNALAIIMSREGATAATNARHLSQLLLRLKNPTKESRPLWAAMGLTPETMAGMGGIEIIERVFEEIRKRGGITVSKVSDEALEAAEELSNVTGAIDPGAAGIAGGAAPWLAELTGRIESLRAFGVIFSRWEDQQNVPGFRKELEMLDNSLGELDNGFKRFEDRVSLQKAGQAFRNFRIQALESLRPVLDAFGDITTKFLTWDQSTRAVLYGGVLGAILLRGRGMLGKFGGPGAVAAAQAGGAPPTGSFSNPIWVMIHPLSPLGKGPGGGLPVPIPGKGGSRAGRAARALWRLGRFAGPVAGAAVAADFFLNAEGTNAYGSQENIDASQANGTLYIYKGEYLWGSPNEAQRAAFRAQVDRRQGNRSQVISQASPAISAGAASLAQLFQSSSRYAEIQTGVTRVGAPGIPGGGVQTVRVRIEPTDEAKKLLKPVEAEVHVPVSAWAGGAFPTSRGKNRTFRSDRQG